MKKPGVEPGFFVGVGWTIDGLRNLLFFRPGCLVRALKNAAERNAFMSENVLLQLQQAQLVPRTDDAKD